MAQNDPEYRQPSLETRTFEQWLESIEGANAAAVERFIDDGDNRRRLLTAPGSREAHHAWKGGYAEHIRQTMMIAAINYQLMEETGLLTTLPEDEQFTLSDALTVLYLHDIEKPFIYIVDSDGTIEKDLSMTKADRKSFRSDVIVKYGFEMTPTMENALLHVEGVRDEYYVPGERADQPLAALCHAADTLSARAYYDYK